MKNWAMDGLLQSNQTSQSHHQGDRWIQAGVNEFARSAHGHGDCAEGMDAVTFIPESKVPDDKNVTQAQCVVHCRPEKDEPWRPQITCGGDQLSHDGDTTTHGGASMEVIKLQLDDIKHAPWFRPART